MDARKQPLARQARLLLNYNLQPEITQSETKYLRNIIAVKSWSEKV